MPSALAQHWSLDPAITFLNHGSFGACPQAICEEQQRLRQRLERHPVRFMEDALPELLAEAKVALAGFVGAQPDDLALVTNATTGVNAVLRSLALGPGDELLTTNHEYNAVQNALEFVAARTGARIVVADIPFPLGSADEVVSAVLSKASEHTRLALLYHISSPTAVVFPVAALVAGLAARGIDALIDGAHAPGMVELDLDGLGAAYYTGNCHKWMCTPKGVAFLHVRRDRQHLVRPTVISHGANSPLPGSRFQHEFDWQGTADPTGPLCLPDAIHYVGSLVDGGWPAVRKHNHTLAVRAREILCDALSARPLCPSSMLGSMAAVRLPDAAPGTGVRDPLQTALYGRHRIEVPIVRWPMCGLTRYVRVSAQLYNSEADYLHLANALVSELD